MEDQFLYHHCIVSYAFGIGHTVFSSALRSEKKGRDLRRLEFCSSVESFPGPRHGYRSEIRGDPDPCCMDLVLEVIHGRGSKGNHVHVHVRYTDGRKAPHHHSTLESPSDSMTIRMMCCWGRVIYSYFGDFSVEVE